MRKLAVFLKPYRFQSIIAPLFKMLEALFELFVPIVMAGIIDEGIKLKDYDIIKRNGLILIAFCLIGLICSLIAQYFAAKVAVSFAETLRNALFNKIINFSYENIDRFGSSSLITRITNDINQVQNGVNMVLRLLLRSPFVVFGAMIMAFTVNVRAALIFVVLIPLLFIAVSLITIITIPLYAKIQKGLDTLTSHVRENLTGVRVVRAFNQETREKEEFAKDNTFFASTSLFTARISAVLNPITVIIVNVCMLVLIYNGSNLVNTGNLTSGQVYALVNFMSQILVELVKLTNLFITINKSFASAGRIGAMLDTENALLDNGTLNAGDLKESESLISFNNVSFSYPDSKETFIDNMTFDIKPGETIGIIGGTGSGKSTIASLLMRFYDVTGGEIKFNNTNIKELTLSSLRNSYSYVPQKAQLFSGTLKENLLLANPNATKEEMLTAVELSQCGDFVESKGSGLNMPISEGGANLSGGQKQRVCIARALVKKAPVLILDDSSSALDYATDSRLRKNIKALNNLTTIIIAQRINSIQDADRIMVLDDGDIVGFDSHDNLLNTCDVYKEIYNSQKAFAE